MATTIYFNGRVTSVPGSYVETDAEGLATVGIAATGIVAVLGEAEGGKPGVVHTLTNPSAVKRLFTDGDLREAGPMLFNPSSDPDVPAGAQVVKFYKVNPATQSARTLANGDGDAMILTSRDYGLKMNKVGIESRTDPDPDPGFFTFFEDLAEEFVTVDDAAQPASIDHVGSSSGIGTLTQNNVVGLVISMSDLAAGRFADQIASFDNLGRDGEITQPVPARSLDVSSSAVEVALTVIVYGKVAGVADSETYVISAAPIVGAKLFDVVYGFLIVGTPVGTITLTEPIAPLVVGAGTVSQGLVDITANPLFAPAATASGSDEGKLTLVIDDASTPEVMLIGFKTGAVAAIETVVLTGLTKVLTLTDDWESISAIGLGVIPAARTVGLGGAITPGSIYIDSTNLFDSAVVSVYGLDAAGAPQSENVALDGSTNVPVPGSWSAVLGMEVSNLVLGDVRVWGDMGGPTDFVIFNTSGASPISQVLSRGLYKFTDFAGTTLATPNVNGAITFTANPASKTRLLIIGLDSTSTFAMEVVDLAAGSGTTTTLWSLILSIASSHAGDITTLVFDALNLDVATYPTMKDWKDFTDGLSSWNILDAAGNLGAIQVTELDHSAAVGETIQIGVPYIFERFLAATVDLINLGSTIVTAEAVAGASGMPDDTPDRVFLSGAIEGVTTFADWQAGLDALKSERVSTVVPLTSDAAIHAAALAHVNFMVGAGRGERDLILGADPGTSLEVLRQEVVALNSRHARYAPQEVERFNEAGGREFFPPYFAAALAAGMQAGTDGGESLTNKFVNVLDTRNDSSYDIIDDAHRLIQSGLFIIETVAGRGFRILRNVTTHLIDNNLAFVEASVNEAVNISTQNFRESLEAIVGQKGFIGTKNNAENQAIAILNLLVLNTIITAWRALDITLSGDVMVVDVEIAPVIPVNFVTTTLHLVLA